MALYFPWRMSVIFSKFKIGKTIMYTDDTSILNMGINPEELKIAISANRREVVWYFESIYILT